MGNRTWIRGTVTLAVAALLAGALITSPVGAAKSGVTKSKVKKIAGNQVKKQGDPRFINVGEKAGDADTLDGVDSTAFLQSQGLTLITASHKDWISQNEATLTADYSRNVLALQTAGAETGEFAGTGPALPVALYGRQVQLLGVELCYATSTNSTLDTTFLTVYTNSTTGFSSTQELELSDETDRTDDACRLYTLGTPFALTGEQLIEFSVSLDFSAAGTFRVGRTTFVLAPTGTPATALSRLGGPSVTLQPVDTSEGEATP